MGDWVITPRPGKPVEVQALWYNALCFIEELSEIFGDKVSQDLCQGLLKQVSKSFNDLFWNDATGCLYDCMNGQSMDGSIRPNQIFAVSLTHSMLSPDRARKVVDVVKRELFTPFGLRSLAPSDKQYQGHYQGDPWARDGAYHQGTVWSWLMGPFITAYLKVNNQSQDSCEETKQWLISLNNHLEEAGLGQISEIFDGDSPHNPRGCIAQAWSVGEILRASIENVHYLSRLSIAT